MDIKNQLKLFSEDRIGHKEKNYRKKKKIVFKHYSQNQQFLLPKNLDDFISDGHIARFVSQIIDKMDIQFIIETYKGGGTSSYDPRLMLKCWILGFIYKLYSCRLLAKNTRENLAFIWISGNQRPDFRTLNNFRLRLKDDIKKIFKQIILHGINLGVIQGEEVFVDHTKNQANTNRHKVIWKKQVNKQLEKIESELDELFKYIDEINQAEEKAYGNKDLPEEERNNFDKQKIDEIAEKINTNVKEGKISKEDGREKRKRISRIKELIERKQIYEDKNKILNGRNSYSKTDHDAVAMMMKDKKIIRPAYNEGIIAENGFVLNYTISNNASDSVSFIQLTKGTIENIGKLPLRINGDGAYGNEENSMFLEEKRIENFLKYSTYHNEKSKSWVDKRFRLNDFIYDEKNDKFICKNGIRLHFIEEYEDKTATGYIKKIRTYKTEEGHCLTCPFRSKCTDSYAKTLTVNWNLERLKQIAKQNLDSEKGKELRKRRGNEVESIFGDQKLNNRKRHYHLRGIKKVELEAGIYYISNNLKRMHILSGDNIEKKKNDENTTIIESFNLNN